MTKFEDLSETISYLNGVLDTVRREKDMLENDIGVIELLVMLKEAYWSQIHEYLYSLNNKSAEEQVRRLCQDIKIKIVPFVENKVYATYKEIEIVGEYLLLLDDFKCLVAYRDLTEYALLMEEDLSNDRKIINMAYENGLIQPILYTSQQMVLTGSVKKLFKNTPTGYFKCVDENTIVFTPKGNIKIKDLQIGDEVYSMKNNSICVERVLDKANTIKSQVKIQTRGGRELVISPDHRMLTQRGYIEARDITCEDYLYRQNCVIKNGIDIPNDELEFISFMIFEGHCKENNYSFEKIIYKDFVWEQISKIEYDSKEIPMVDIMVSGEHNFIANGYVSHNSYSDVIIISWIQGINLNADCLKVVGNPKMVTKTINGVSNMMLKEKYAKIFPFYAKYERNPQQMFKILAPRNGEMLLSHAVGIDYSLLCISKETPIDGGRYKYRFYDDITNSKYKTNIEMHEKDDASYNDQWKKRRYTEFDDCEWFTGTVYFYLDFLSKRRDENGFALAVPLPKFKYTKYCAEKKAVFVVIPKLDYETDECTFPQIYSTEQAKKDRSNDFDTFQAMEQGLPTIPEGMPFDYSKMKVWTELPKKESEGGSRSDFTMGVLDLPRTGDNNLSLLVFSKCGELHYLVDGIYQKKKLDTKLEDGRTMLDVVCDKIVQRKMKHLVVETNVCSNIKEQLEEKLLKNYKYSCKIYEVYSTMKKEDKIFDSQSDIQQFIVIPQNGIFGLSSDVGRAVFEIVTWSTKAKSDDSIDCCAMYVREFVNNKRNGLAQVHSFKR